MVVGMIELAGDVGDAMDKGRCARVVLRQGVGVSVRVSDGS